MHLNQSFYDHQNDTYCGIYYNNETKKWSVNRIERPQVPAYILTKYTPSYIRAFVLQEDCRRVDVQYKYKEFALAEELGLSNFKDDVRNKKYVKEMVYLDPRLYGADFKITDTYLKDFNQEQEALLKSGAKDIRFDNIFQAYLDIETDVPMAPSDRDKQQVYMITTYFEETNEMYLDILMDKRYNGYEKMLSPGVIQRGFELKKGEVEEVYDVFTEEWIQMTKGNFDKEIRDNKKFNKSAALAAAFKDIISTAKYVVRMYTDEMKLIMDAWQRVMRIKRPNYLQIFNADFDVSHCYRRYIALGGDPKDLFTDPRIGEYYNLYCKTVREINGTYRPPNVPEMHPCNEPQYYETSTCTNIQDTAVIHYSLRVKKEDSYSLEATAQRTVGFGKLNYSMTGANIFTLPYIDFALAAEYCIRDTMVLKAVEMQTNNMMATIVKRYIMNTEFDRLNTSMDYCQNTFDFRMREEGEIQRNSINSYLLKMPRSFYEGLQSDLLLNLYDALTEKGGITGGYVASPNKVRKEGKRFFKHIPNYKSHTLTVDLDAEAHYPSAVAANNIGLESLIGQIMCIEPNESSDNVTRTKLYSEIILNSNRIAMKIINRDIVGIGELFNLPSLEELVEMHYNIRCNWKVASEDNSKVFNLKPESTNIIKVMKKMFSDKFNKIDKLAEKESLSGYGLLSREESFVRYYGTLVSTKLYDDSNTQLNMCEYMLEDYDYVDDTAITSFEKNEEGIIVGKVNRRTPFLKYVTPKNKFDKIGMKLLNETYLSDETLNAITASKDEVYYYEVGENKLTLTNRLFAIPITKDTEVKCMVWQDEDNDVFFEFDSKTNIKINKDTVVILNVKQVFSVLVA